MKGVNKDSHLNVTQELIHLAAQHVNDILTFAIQHSSLHSAVIISDAESPLAVMLTEAYRQCLPTATFIDFYSTPQEKILAFFETLVPADLVILIQSTSFRLDAFRLRIELFQKSLKVIEHPHLARMTDLEGKTYIEALAYDPTYFRTVGHALKNKMDSATKTVIDSGGEYLVYESRLEQAKLNIGDYANMKNIGGQFPIGEVFTEAENLERVNGRIRIFAFGDTSFSVDKPDKPITLVIQKGRVIDTLDSTPEFDRVLANIRADEGEVWVRELGFGLNRAFSEDKTVSDIGTYERMCGVHLSLGAKHTIYKKPHFKPSNTWHHVDVFVKTHCVYLDDVIVYENNAWQV